MILTAQYCNGPSSVPGMYFLFDLEIDFCDKLFCWNVDKLGVDPGGKWSNVICNYKWIRTEKLWMTNTSEIALFWLTILYFIGTDGQSFIPPTLIHKSSKINEGRTLYLPDIWVVRVTESGYMD